MGRADHGVESVEVLPFEHSWLNVEPSRFGTLESLLETIAHCEVHDVRLYGGGQFELGVGRGQIQLLASLFHPDSPNEVAPGGYNEVAPGGYKDVDLSADRTGSPLPAPSISEGFRWEE